MVPRQDRHENALTPAQTRKIRRDFLAKTRRRTLERAKLAELGGYNGRFSGDFPWKVVETPSWRALSLSAGTGRPSA